MADTDHHNYTESDCSLNYSDMDWYKKSSMATGISAWVCLLIILFPTLVLGIFYMYRYKTTFLMRLFFYLTIAGTMADANYALLFTVQYPLPNKIWLLQMCIWIELTNVALYIFTMLLELFLIFLINLNLLSKMYKFKSTRQQQASEKHVFRKRYEILLVIFYHLLCAVLTTLTILIVKFLKTTDSSEAVKITFYYVPPSVDIAISFISFVVFLVWLINLRRRHLLRQKYNTVCKEIGFILTFLALLLLLWSLYTIIHLIDKFSSETILLLCDVALPLIHATTSLPFLVYICVTIRRQRAKKQKQQDKNNPSNPEATAPPSDRVSVDSDTNKRAKKFQSPSTAEPSDVTPLLINRDMV